jgi:hypothetical protein
LTKKYVPLSQSHPGEREENSLLPFLPSEMRSPIFTGLRGEIFNAIVSLPKNRNAIYKLIFRRNSNAWSTDPGTQGK